MTFTPYTGDTPVIDMLSDYLREIGEYALLNAAEELDLAQQIERGRQAAHRLTAPRVTSLRRRLLHGPIVRGHLARESLINSNLRLVVSIAKKYQGRGLSLMDLIQEGNLGLMRAVDKFDWRKGNRFSTYATNWIRQACGRAVLEKGHAVRRPVHIGESLNRLRKTRERLAQELERDPTAAEIGQVLGRDAAWVTQIWEYGKTACSLQMLVGPEEATPLGELLAAEGEPIDEQVNGARGDIHAVLAGMEERKRQIVELRYGLLDGRQRTLEEVGREFDITRERIRQLLDEAQREMRRNKRLWGHVGGTAQ